MKVNLTGIEAAKSEAKESTNRFIQKGLQPLTITEVVETKAASGNEGLEVTFTNPETQAFFKHKFWLSAGALPRLVYLIEKYTGNPVPSGDLGIEVISALLVGKTKNVVVDAEARNSQDGKYINEWATLRFAGFVEPEGKDAEPRVADKTTKVSGGDLLTGQSTTTADSDLPW